ncbi:MAG: D-alanine--D-alanine ligase [Prevotellaceae bacterium]|nr:D-alanine--D-alanine ligase [Prevotellaceae bacterium]
MNKKKKVALVVGGNSPEWKVSVMSGRNVALYINRDKYDLYEVQLRGEDWRVEEDKEINKADFTFLQNGEMVKFDVALIMIHGAPGEDGVLPAYLERLGIPHTSSRSNVSALAFNKYVCKRHLREAGILMAKEVLIQKGDIVDEQDVVDRLGLPLFVKPNCGGSSFGITKVKSAAEIKPALNHALKECDTVLVEEYIAGRELTNGILKTSTQTIMLPVTEIVSNNEFFDYQAKYEGASIELTPAPIPDTLSDKVQGITSKIFDYIGCNGFIRVDYIVRGEDVLFLEVNTIPGMTQMSLVPQQVHAAGIPMESFINLLIEDALYRFGRA